MTTELTSPQRFARLRFFGLYALSIALILIVAASFWNIKTEGSSENETSAIGNTNPRIQNVWVQTDAFLHSRLQNLNQQYLVTINNGDTSKETAVYIEALENAFRVSLDSLTQTDQSLTNIEATSFTQLIIRFKEELESRSLLHQKHLQLMRFNAGASSTTKISEEVKRLRNSLSEREQQIQRLQQNASAQPGLGAPSNNADVSKLKAELYNVKKINDRLRSQSSELSKSYQAIVADNRRLLSQLQSSRKQ